MNAVFASTWVASYWNITPKPHWRFRSSGKFDERARTAREIYETANMVLEKIKTLLIAVAEMRREALDWAWQIRQEDWAEETQPSVIVILGAVELV